MASSTISATGSFSGDISDNVEDDDGDEYAKNQQVLVAAAIAAASNSGATGSEASAPGTPQMADHTPTHRASSDSEKRRRRPASVPLRKSLSQGGVPETDQVNQRGIPRVEPGQNEADEMKSILVCEQEMGAHVVRAVWKRTSQPKTESSPTRS